MSRTQRFDTSDQLQASHNELLSRIGGALAAQRTEFFRFAATGQAVLVAAFEVATMPPSGISYEHASLSLGWFPWSLGNIKPVDYLFVRNASSLPVTPDSHSSLGDYGFSSVIHFPIMNNALVVAGVCAYWTEPRSDWPQDRWDSLHEWSHHLALNHT